MSRLRKPLVTVVCSAVAALALAACGTGAVGSSDKVETSGTGSITEATIDVALKYTDGTRGKADMSLEPVKIGFVNQQGGTPAWPEYEATADAVVKFINAHLGGIDGHPVKLVKCVIQSEEDGQKCAAEFLAADVPIAELGTAVVGNATFYRTVNGDFPVLVTASGGKADGTTEHVYELDGGAPAVLTAFIRDAKKAGDKKVAILSTSNPGGKYNVREILRPRLTKNGIDVTAAFVDDDATGPEYVSAVQASGAREADSIMLIASGAKQCISVYDALQQLSIDTRVITAYGCYADPVPAATGAGLENWTFYGNATNPRAVNSAEAKAFRNIMEVYGAAKFITIGLTPKTFTDFFAITKMGNAIGFGKLSGAAFEAQIKRLRGPLFMVPGNIKCGHYPDPLYVSICGDSVAVSELRDGEWRQLEPIQVVTLT